MDEFYFNIKENLDGFSNTYYAKDKTTVFINAYGKKFTVFVPEDLTTFKVLNVRYSKDAKNVYHYGKILEGADAKSFEADEDHWGKDINGRWTPVGKLEKE
ncbi:Uncharacterised protein [Candidatus Venteria ishoeyi]|uniref:Uncharacterized protein n=1 Tax=Candidatus Venteria ishoeyi TaxID=1899563 RepID=A0A1H6F7D3_9GAMM|nr:Uncharacterised protein [Candidatus Venteria ishoeyi]